jgi:hypothetical protein
MLPAHAEPDADVKLQQLKDIGTLPEEKLAMRPEDRLDPKRPNPFAERAKPKEAKAVETVETEEIKIRRIFDTLKISGLTKINGKYSALLGDIILEEGAQLGPVIQNQTQILRVTRITNKFIEIQWVEGVGFESVAPRKIVKRVELNPRVGVMLAAQPAGSSDINAMTYLDENGKVVWPSKMAPEMGGMIDNLPSHGVASALTPEEEAALMQASPQGNGSAEPEGKAPEDTSVGAPRIDPATAIEDPVQPAAEDADAEAAANAILPSRN